MSDVDYCRVEDFVIECPALAELQPGHVTSDKTCFYYRGKKQKLFVYRWPKFLGPQYYSRSRHLFERHVPKAPPQKHQTVLDQIPRSHALAKRREMS